MPPAVTICQRRWARWAIAVLAAAVLLPAVSPARAAPGDLDPTFGAGGRVTTYLTSSTFFPFDAANALVQQPDGKLVVAGQSCSNVTSRERACEFALARYRLEGTLDPEFSGDGRVITSFDAPVSRDYAAALIVQSDGKIVAGGSGLLRYNADGSPDAGFGAGGRAAGVGPISALALQADGRIAALGTSSAGFVLARYNPDGSIDASFGAGGRVTSAAALGSALVVLPDG